MKPNIYSHIGAGGIPWLKGSRFHREHVLSRHRPRMSPPNRPHVASNRPRQRGCHACLPGLKSVSSSAISLIPNP